MGTLVLIGLSLLAASGPDSPAAGSGTAADASSPSPDPAQALARYNELREKTPNSAAAQWKLALWCEQNGLAAEAFVHFAVVARLSPTREAAWKKLGFKKHGGRWMTDEQIADEDEQKKADKLWGPRLKAIHKDVHGGKRQVEALDALAEVKDPRAVPSVYREFGAGGAADQVLAIQILGQIEAADASKVLAVLAVYGKSPDVRRRATETLRGRKPDEFLALLVNMLADPIKYEVRPVGGPGSPGVLVVQGERFDIRRFYAPPAPNYQFRPGDVVSFDNFGMPVFSRPLGGPVSKAGVPGSKSLVNEDSYAVQFSTRQAMIQAQQGAISAQLQLQGDISKIERLNAARNSFNEVVKNVVKESTGKEVGDKPEDRRNLLAGAGGPYKDTPKKTPRKPTIDEVVPLAYMPQFGQLGFIRRVVVDT